MRGCWLLMVGVLVGALCGSVPARAAGEVERIRQAGHLACGTVQNADDYDSASVHGDLSEFGGAICHAVAIAILGDTAKVDVQPFPAEQAALGALQSGTVDLVVGLSPSATVAMHFGVAFGKPVFFDSQRLMVSKKTGITDVAALKDQLICALDLSPPERTLHDVMAQRRVPFALMTHSEQGEMDAAIAVRHCAAGTAMESRLAQSRANFHAVTSDFVFLPDRLAIAPVAPATRYGDQRLSLIVDWTTNALIEAEALGITQANATDAMRRDDMRSEQLSGRDFATAQALGLPHDWAVKVIAGSGNYGEIFERTLGRPYHLDRGLNALWTAGGLLYASPML